MVVLVVVMMVMVVAAVVSRVCLFETLPRVVEMVFLVGGGHGQFMTVTF